MVTEKNWSVFAELDGPGYLCKVTVYVPDRPGILEPLARTFATHKVNITYFYYNRSEHPHRVLIEGRSEDLQALQQVRQGLEEKCLLREQASSSLKLGIMDLHSLLQLGVYLEPRPGTLAAFAHLLHQRNANVIYMAYNEALSPTTATVTLVVQDTREIDELLKDLHRAGYYYSVEYQGAEEKEAENIIGLNLVEYFYFRLKRLLGEEDTEKLRRVVEASQKLSEALVSFYREAGKDLAASKVFTNILTFAASSRFKTGERFSYRRLPSLPLGELLVHSFRLPTGGNLYLLESGEELVMVDGGYGIYYQDAKQMLRENGFQPERVRRILLTHADADHAGMAGHWAREWNSQVLLHPDAEPVLEHENRAWGSGSHLTELNHYFTVLVNAFTDFVPPPAWKPFSRQERGQRHGFPIIATVEMEKTVLEVLESKGGHVPGQVFFLEAQKGLIFTGDYLLFVPSLDPKERDFLNLPKFMITSTNANSLLFREEMQALQELVLELDAKLEGENRGMLVLPGHGDYFPARLLRQ
ncbi:MBL fold metallo-hydrolase [Desulfothermobacter acidiphilus]|uniref:MBL fold metallo-hydrolase n=1 Tax=Desulfothermobacter acidiphilus TaxID=1938353 RepID=UPI003F89E18D